MASPSNKSDTKNADDSLPRLNHRTMTVSEITGVMNPIGVAHTFVKLFSRVDGQRPPPFPSKTTHLRMVTILPSPFCEAVRWGLDILERKEDNPYYYTEDTHPPPFHAFYTIPITRGAFSRTPILLFPDGKYMTESGEILPELCPFLYPPEISSEVKQFVSDVSARLGSTMRSLVYYFYLGEDQKYYKPYIDYAVRGTSKVEAFLFGKMLDKGIDKVLWNTMECSDEMVQKSIEAILSLLKEVSDRLEQNRGEYIFDTPTKKYGFTAADLVFSACSFLMIQPKQMLEFVPDMNLMPPKYRALIQQFNQTKAGEHCRKMYQRHRPLNKDGAVHLKNVNRDKTPFRESWFILGAVGLGAATVVATVLFRRRTR